MEVLDRYLASVGGEPASTLGTPANGVTSPVPARESTDARIQAIRDRLPPPVRTGRGHKTRGEWFTPSGEIGTVVSGTDELATRVDEVLREANVPRSPLVSAKHAELKLAAHMRDNGITRAILIQNNVPCLGTYGCDALISVVLPEGYVLTVHGPGGFEKEYPGGAKPW